MKILSGLLVVLLLSSCQTSHKQSAPPPEAGPFRVQDYFPQARRPDGGIILDKVYFTISYNEQWRVPNWVTYTISAKHLRNKTAERQNKFFADPVLKQKQIAYAKPTDYAKSGYDRGHLASSEDFVWDQNANDATFVMSNMVPQKSGLNRGSWARLEDAVRKWACTEEEVLVITGPILSGALTRLPSQVGIPERFFKVVVDLTPPQKALGFIYSQEDGAASYHQKVVSVQEVQKIIGYDFFTKVPSELKNKLLTEAQLARWKEADCMKAVATKGKK